MGGAGGSGGSLRPSPGVGGKRVLRVSCRMTKAETRAGGSSLIRRAGARERGLILMLSCSAQLATIPSCCCWLWRAPAWCQHFVQMKGLCPKQHSAGQPALFHIPQSSHSPGIQAATRGAQLQPANTHHMSQLHALPLLEDFKPLRQGILQHPGTACSP